MKALEEYILMVVCTVTEEFIFLRRKSKRVTIQMKALDECILMVFFLLLKKVHFLAMFALNLDIPPPPPPKKKNPITVRGQWK